MDKSCMFPINGNPPHNPYRLSSKLTLGMVLGYNEFEGTYNTMTGCNQEDSITVNQLNHWICNVEDSIDIFYPLMDKLYINMNESIYDMYESIYKKYPWCNAS